MSGLSRLTGGASESYPSEHLTDAGGASEQDSALEIDGSTPVASDADGAAAPKARNGLGERIAAWVKGPAAPAEEETPASTAQAPKREKQATRHYFNENMAEFAEEEALNLYFPNTEESSTNPFDEGRSTQGRRYRDANSTLGLFVPNIAGNMSPRVELERAKYAHLETRSFAISDFFKKVEGAPRMANLTKAAIGRDVKKYWNDFGTKDCKGLVDRMKLAWAIMKEDIAEATGASPIAKAGAKAGAATLHSVLILGAALANVIRFAAGLTLAIINTVIRVLPKVIKYVVVAALIAAAVATVAALIAAVVVTIAPGLAGGLALLGITGALAAGTLTAAHITAYALGGLSAAALALVSIRGIKNSRVRSKAAAAEKNQRQQAFNKEMLAILRDVLAGNTIAPARVDRFSLAIVALLNGEPLPDTDDLSPEESLVLEKRFSAPSSTDSTGDGYGL